MGGQGGGGVGGGGAGEGRAEGVCSLANYSVAYEETRSNRVSDFRNFVCSLLPKNNLFLTFSTIFLTLKVQKDNKQRKRKRITPVGCSG